MFSTILGWIKGIITSFSLKNNTPNLDMTISNDMQTSIELWNKIYTNKAPWLTKDVRSLELAADICTEFARLVLLEHKSELTGSSRANFINTYYQKVLRKMKEDKLEIALATGGIALKPYVQNGNIYTDFVESSRFFPTECNNNQEITGAIFVSQYIEGDNQYSRLEYHSLNEFERTYTITNKVYVSKSKTDLGNEISLKNTKWSNLDKITVIENITKPLFVYFKVPLANTIDTQSPLGVSVFSRAVDKIKKADTQYGRVDWEYEASEKALYVNELAIRKQKDNTKKFSIDKLKNRIYKALNMSDDDFYKEYSPEIRDEAFWRGLNRHLERIEFSCQLAYGTLSEPIYSDKTAEEIKTSKQRSFSAVSKIQGALQIALEHLVYVYDCLCSLYGLAPEGRIEQSNEWDDSLIIDSESEQRIRQQEVREKLRTKISYLMWRYGFTEEQAKEELKKIREETAEQEKSIFNQQEE